MDFNRRIVAVYEFKNNREFWGSETPITIENLYPKEDIMKDICNKIKHWKYYLDDRTVDKNSIGEFLTLWNTLEEDVRHKTNNNNFGQGIVTLSRKRLPQYEKNIKGIDNLRKFRNKLVHGTNKVLDKQIQNEIIKLKNILKELNIKF